MVPAAVWSVGRRESATLESDRGRLLAGFGVLAANFALFLLPPVVGVLALLGVMP